MGEKIVVGPFNEKGLVTYNEPFFIDDGSFPTLQNMYTQRGRLKRKRGTQFLTRLMRYFDSSNVIYFSGTIPVLNASAEGNLLTDFGLQTNGNIVPTTVTITVTGGAVGPYTDPLGDGTLSPTGTINYATGAIILDPLDALKPYNAVFLYFPDLPVMGLEDLILTINDIPKCLAFDTIYSYQIDTTFPYDAHDVSFYNNPATGTYPAYVQKDPPNDWTPVNWNGQDYQQFYTVNYQGALWATNGINIPFNNTNIGMQFAGPVVTAVTDNVVTYVGDTPTTLTVTITNCPLVIGDFVFVNEWTHALPASALTLNLQSGYVTACAPNTPALAVKTLTITFPFATIAAGPYTPGIVQYLTNRSSITRDNIRWYNGDPTSGSATNPFPFTHGQGWVNFMPPLSQFDYSVSELPLDQYYLVGGRIIFPFKDRLLIIGPVVQSSTGTPIYLQDTVVFSQNGTPYYTASFTGDPISVTTIFHEILVPINQTATATAWFEDQIGFGGYIQAGFDGAITTAGLNEDALILGFDSNLQSRFIYTGDDITPFVFYTINTELGSTSTFSIINFDEYVLTKGNRGFIITSQDQSARIDVPIIDEVFQIKLSENGNERITAQRDFINEWAYLTYPSTELSNALPPESHKFPNKTLLYNYRENTWATLLESYTTYGQFRKTTGFIWANVGLIYPTWSSWNDPWEAGESNLNQPDIVAGNQQGFVLLRDEGTAEGISLYIRDISGNVVTCPDHCLNNGDYIYIKGAIGTVSAQVNGKIFSVMKITKDTFELNPVIAGGTYDGLGTITRLYVPLSMTKQFPVSWGISRKVRLGVQQYLITATDSSQITLLIFLSQNSSSAYNNSEILPSVNSINDSLIYSTVLFTCPESTNLGLTPANINLQMVTAIQQGKIWHRVNTSLLGDTVQIGFTLSDSQMRTLNEEGEFLNQFSEIEIHGFILDVNPSMVLA